MTRFLTKVVNESIEVKLIGDLDIDSTEVIEIDIMPVVENFTTVEFNFEQVPFIDSSGIGLLLDAVQILDSKGIKVTITNVKNEVMDIFDLLQIPDILGEGVFLKS